MVDAVSFSNATIARSFGGQNLPSLNRVAVQQILGEYDPESLSKNDIKNINDQFRANGIKPTAELARELKRTGFDPESIGTGLTRPKAPMSQPDAKTEKARNNLLLVLHHIGSKSDLEQASRMIEAAIADIKTSWMKSGNSFVGNLVDFSV